MTGLGRVVRPWYSPGQILGKEYQSGRREVDAKQYMLDCCSQMRA
jgi:hypothetical protein